jgi:hypothetical protein
MLSAQFRHISHAFFSTESLKHFQPFWHIFARFFANSENAAKSKFRQEMLNIQKDVNQI